MMISIKKVVWYRNFLFRHRAAKICLLIELNGAMKSSEQLSKIDGKTKIAGVFGYPVEHSLSPLFHNAAFARLGLNFVYLPFPVKPEELKVAVESIRSLNIVGMNVTIPHKEKVLPYLDEISPEAKVIGAVNTIHNKEGKLIGYNTDGDGFIESLKKQGGFDPKDKNVFLLGAGGAAYAISFALIKNGIKKLILANRTYSKGRALLEHLKKIFQDKCQLSLVEFIEKNSSFIMSEIDLLINATSIGMHSGDPGLIAPEILPPNIFIYDVVYNRKTPLLELAEERKLAFLGGLDMLVYQGALSFEIWTDQKAPVEVMKKALRKELSK